MLKYAYTSTDTHMLVHVCTYIWTYTASVRQLPHGLSWTSLSPDSPFLCSSLAFAKVVTYFFIFFQVLRKTITPEKYPPVCLIQHCYETRGNNQKPKLYHRPFFIILLHWWFFLFITCYAQAGHESMALFLNLSAKKVRDLVLPFCNGVPLPLFILWP